MLKWRHYDIHNAQNECKRLVRKVESFADDRTKSLSLAGSSVRFSDLFDGSGTIERQIEGQDSSDTDLDEPMVPEKL